MKTLYLILFTLTALVSATAGAEDDSSKKIMISPDIYSVEVMHNGKPVKLMRNQQQKNEIVDFYRRTDRGKIQPMQPFAPHAVETIGELEMIDYLQQRSAGDHSVMIIDSRTLDWVKRSGMIPGAVNIPFTKFSSSESTLEIMEDRFDVLARNLRFQQCQNPGDVLQRQLVRAVTDRHHQTAADGLPGRENQVLPRRHAKLDIAGSDCSSALIKQLPNRCRINMQAVRGKLRSAEYRKHSIISRDNKRLPCSRPAQPGR